MTELEKYVLCLADREERRRIKQQAVCVEGGPRAAEPRGRFV